MTVYDLYGYMSDDIEGAKNILESSLGIQFGVRESTYQGGEYFQCGKTNDEHFVLKRNVDPIDGEPAELSFPVHQILFYVSDTTRSANLQDKMNEGARDFALLRHEELA